ncbi:MAG: hypothetical protein RBU21_18535 [FCB group bacterium]|nr:hypothetical protein [FCB group bacterium]
MSAKEMRGVVQDERTVAAENVGRTWAIVFLNFALLIDGCYRSLVLNKAAWDLMALACLSGFIVFVYKARQKVPYYVGRKYILFLCLLALLAAVIGAITAVLKMHSG